MKRLIIGAITAVLMGGGMVAVSSETASAACPYTGCVTTYTNVFAPDTVKRGARAKICIAVNTGGDGRPKGRVSIRVERSAGGYKYLNAKKYNDNRECFRTSRLKKPGRYFFVAHFDRRPGSPYKDSNIRDVFSVVKR